MININFNLHSKFQIENFEQKRIKKEFYELGLYNQTGYEYILNAYIDNPMVQSVDSLDEEIRTVTVYTYEYPDTPLYIKIADVSKIIGIHPQDLVKDIVVNPTDFLAKQNIDCIVHYALDIPPHLEIKATNIIKKIGYSQFYKLLEDQKIHSKFLEDLRIVLDEFSDLYDSEKIELNTTDIKSLMKLISTISPNYLKELISQSNKKLIELETKIILKTFLSIGYDLFVPNSYLYKEKTWDNNQISTYAYAISGSIVLLVGSNLNFKSNQSLTFIHEAFLLNEQTSYIRRKKIYSQNPEKIVERELNLFKQFVEIGKSQNFALPFIFTITTKTKNSGIRPNQYKWIAFQLRYPTQGTELHKASLHQILHAYYGASRGLADLHEYYNYAHCDFKTQNLLLDKPLDEGKLVEAKIIDFEFTDTISNHLRGSTCSYLAPEYLSYDLNSKKIKALKIPIHYKIDSFSLGVSLLETFSKKYNLTNYKSSQTLLDKFKKTCVGQCDKKEFKSIFSDLNMELKNSSIDDQVLPYLKSLLKITQHLMNHDKNQRWSCAKAAEELKKIETKYLKSI